MRSSLGGPGPHDPCEVSVTFSVNQTLMSVSVETLKAEVESSGLDPVEDNEARAPYLEDQEGTA